MDRTYWQKQTSAEPLFPDLLWSRPENKRQAGKLLIVGGNLHGFAAPAEAYQTAMKAGIGTAKVLLPDALQKPLTAVQDSTLDSEFGASTISGSFSQKALDKLLGLSQAADGVLLAGDFGRNSETAILFEKFLQKNPSPITLAKDAVDYATADAAQTSQRSNTTLVLSVAQLQRFCKALSPSRPIRFSMDLLQMVEALHVLSQSSQCNYVTKHLGTVLAAAQGRVSTTKLKEPRPIWRVTTAAYAAVWWLQNPAKPFEAITTSIQACFQLFDNID